MLSKILIANRGEIAVRIASTCRKMGISTVAVFSEADRNALHVKACDEAYEIGPPPAAESYLLADRILEAARRSGSQAIHPGYGFLSENAGFARAVQGAGLVWIGPSSDAIELMGSKIESKKLAEKAGVPVVPGYLGDDQSVERLEREAEAIGFPVLIKASAGGGGKGMRVARGASQVRELVEAAKREAQAAFGDPSLLLEKYLDEPRHIEVQVLGDNFGTILHLGERECTIQRRHQKVVEESPSPVITQELREKITDAALALARAAGYSNAGTVEFIYQDGEFYFLEMNTRLQVEHPVTETALGLDLVEAQIRIAAGEKLWFGQEDVQFKRHSFEARLYAEDPDRDFLPSTGRITKFMLPFDTRLDTGFRAGDTISPYYDPMIAKVITSGADRRSALLAMQSALGQMEVEGVRSNLGFLRWIFSESDFVAGNFSTNFIARHYQAGAQPAIPYEAIVAGGAILASGKVRRTGAQDLYPWARSVWRQGRQEILVRVKSEGQLFDCRLSACSGNPDLWSVQLSKDGIVSYTGLTYLKVEEGSFGSGSGTVLLGPEREMEQSVAFTVAGADGAVNVLWAGRTYCVRQAPPLSTDTLDLSVHLSSEDNLESPMPGKVLKVLVRKGDKVAEEQPLVIVEAMKMEFTVRAPHAGRVAALHYEEGAQVAVGDVLVELGK